MLYHNTPLTSKEAKSSVDDILETIDVLGDTINELNEEIENLKNEGLTDRKSVV